ncbi:unnamed protein product [Schistosoma curassoni]|uniref:Uncharacterized protein n=1 Tax=Schistosoma curassoni TaxID=6186 RepID=A0A183KKM1_9TREM|nr:unnamed protein product [Schistosoma curassoni]
MPGCVKNMRFKFEFSRSLENSGGSESQWNLLVTFPRDFLSHGLFGKQLALLGLGDIVVPGIFIAMLLRFDTK